jgi:hypothetical protein
MASLTLSKGGAVVAQTSVTVTSSGPTPRYGYFARDCWLYQPIAAAAKLSWSDQFMGQLRPLVGGVNVNLPGWAPPIYVDPAGQAPINLVDPVHSDGKRWHINGAPVDPTKKCSPDSDRWLVHVSPDGSRSYEFVANGTSRDLTQPYTSGILFDLVNGHGASSGTSAGHGGSNISLLAGLIRKAELAAAVAAYNAGDFAHADLGHRLVCAFPKNMSRSMGWTTGIPAVPNPAVFPAVYSDGTGSATTAPMGTAFRLRQDLDVKSLSATVEQKVWLFTCQRWGFHNAESTGNLIAFYGENTLTAGAYPTGLSSMSGALLTTFMQNMEAVDSPPVGKINTPADFGGNPFYS